MHLKHTLPIFINDDSKILILGSFPSIKSREIGFYYSHPRNRFFPILGAIFNEDISTDIDSRKTFLIKHNIALYDVVEECDIVNSDDSSIKNVLPIDIKSILIKYPNIKIIGIIGNKTKKLFDKYLLNKIKDIKIIYLPSSSPANAKMKDDELIKIYKTLFY